KFPGLDRAARLSGIEPAHNRSAQISPPISLTDKRPILLNLFQGNEIDLQAPDSRVYDESADAGETRPNDSRAVRQRVGSLPPHPNYATSLRASSSPVNSLA